MFVNHSIRIANLFLILFLSFFNKTSFFQRFPFLRYWKHIMSWCWCLRLWRWLLLETKWKMRWFYRLPNKWSRRGWLWWGLSPCNVLTWGYSYASPNIWRHTSRLVNNARYQPWATGRILPAASHPFTRRRFVVLCIHTLVHALNWE